MKNAQQLIEEALLCLNNNDELGAIWRLADAGEILIEKNYDSKPIGCFNNPTGLNNCIVKKSNIQFS